jgi:ATP-dependent RNA helicase DDX27
VEEVLQEEKEEKLIRQAEMEATKGENMIKHHDEIMSRPKRTWFVSADDKATQKDASKKEHEAKMGNVEKKKYDKYAGLSRKQRRNKQAREEVEAEEKEDRGKSRGINASIRAAKKANRPKELGAYEPSRKSMNGKKGKGVGGRPRKVERGD